MVKTLKIDKLRSDLLGTILKVDKCEMKEMSKEKINGIDLGVMKKQTKEITDLRQHEMVSLYKYVGELERTHHHFK